LKNKRKYLNEFFFDKEFKKSENSTDIRMKRYCYPKGNVLYRNLQRTFPLIKYGRGAYLYDATGKKYLDGSGGAAVVNVGHGIKEIAEALSVQASKVAYLSGVQFTHFPVEKLAEQVAEFLPFPGGKVYFLTSGSEAIEASIKLARQYWVENGRYRKYKVISRNPSYHGNTLAALSLSARKHYQETFSPMLPPTYKIPAPYCYRCPLGKVYPDCRVKCAYELEKKIRQLGRDRVSAFITEVIGGSSTGASVPPPEYFPIIREICDKNEVLLITDEVMTGIGRTGKWLACHHFGLVPDIIVLGKGLTSGYAPLSAVAAKKGLVDSLFKRGKSFLHAQTFAHHPVGCAAAAATLDYLRKHGLIDACARMGTTLFQRLSGLRSRPHLGDIRGRGLLIGIEFVQNRTKKTPFPRARKYVEQFVQKCLEKGLVIWPNIGHADGTNGDLVMVAPPFIVTSKEIALIEERLGSALAEMEKIF
jgi:adenosylmethionine-8-amino-7-oxononanoate aminotransferase